MNDTCHVILQDFGPEGGGWGLAAWSLGMGDTTPIAYTGSNPATIEMLFQIAALLSTQTKKATKLVRYDRATELISYPAIRKEHDSYDEASEHLPAG